jgi:hypothetical protein
MSTFVLVMAAGMVLGDGPERVSGEVGECLLVGRWEGTISHEHGKSHDAVVEDGYLAEWWGMSSSGLFTWEIHDEGRARVQLLLNGTFYSGIYRWDGDRISLCYRRVEKGRPTSFRAGDDQHLLILHRVKEE